MRVFLSSVHNCIQFSVCCSPRRCFAYAKLPTLNCVARRIYQKWLATFKLHKKGFRPLASTNAMPDIRRVHNEFIRLLWIVGIIILGEAHYEYLISSFSVSISGNRSSVSGKYHSVECARALHASLLCRIPFKDYFRFHAPSIGKKTACEKATHWNIHTNANGNRRTIRVTIRAARAEPLRELCKVERLNGQQNIHIG